MTDHPVISFVVPVRNDAESLARCLASIRSSARSLRHEIIVADNGSTDDSLATARAAGAIVLDVPGRPVSAVRNAAADTARGDLVAFIDADHEIDPGWAAAAVSLFEDPSVAAAGAQYHAPPQGTWVQRMYDRLRRHRPGTRDVDWLPSGNLAVRRSIFKAMGGFDTTLETCEDVDFCLRLITRGGRLVASDRLRSVHAGDPKTLKALFLGELWRGRDNLRVSLRGPVTVRSLTSLMLPVLNLCALLSVAGGLLLAFRGGLPVAAAGSAVLAASIALRSAALLSTTTRNLLSPVLVSQAAAVAFVYDAARAIALVAGGGHEARRRA